MTTGIGLHKKSLIPLSIAIAVLPVVFFGCSGGGDGDDSGVPDSGSNQGAAQISSTAVQDSVTWITNSVPGCKLYTGAASAASVAAAQDGVAGANVVKQVMSVISEAKKASGTSFTPMAAQQFAGDCGGSLNLSDVHANGITTYTYVFNNFCSLDSSVSPPQQSTVNGTMTSRELGTPSASGPIVSSMELSNTQLTMTAKGETTELSVNGATLTYGVPGTWSPGDPTASNPDRISITQASVRFPSENKTRTLSGFNASTYSEASGNSVINIANGRYTTATHGYVNLATGQPIIMNENGSWVSGSLSLAGSDGNTVLVTPSSTNGVMNIALNGQTLTGSSLDCSGASELSNTEVLP